MIPELVDNVLPEGAHDCTIEEIDAAFGRFWKTDQRIKLTAKLKKFVEEARKSGIVRALIIDGSYVTAKPTPEDIDMIVILRADADPKEGLGFIHLLKDKSTMKREFSVQAYGFHEGSDELNYWIDLFSKVRTDDPDQQTTRLRKGLLRIAIC